MQKILYIGFLLVVSARLSAQSVSGSWYGHADVDLAGMHNNYLTELIIKQKGTRVEGIFGYYFRDKYQSFFIHGRYNPETHETTITNIPIIFYGSISTLNSIDCATNFRGKVILNKMGSSVKGTFHHDAKYKYTCPDLKVNYELDKADNHTDSAIAAGPATATIWKPKDEDFVVDVNKPAPAPTPAPAPKIDSVIAHTDSVKTEIVKIDSTHTDTLKTQVAVVPPPPPPPPPPTDEQKLQASFAKRKLIGNRTLDIESDSVRISFYDNGEIDGD